MDYPKVYNKTFYQIILIKEKFHPVLPELKDINYS